jgi:pimeloyl-ACP methyl ester carboxylesterase
MLDARTGHLIVGGSPMYYNVFGRGSDHLVLIPGLGDGLRTVKGMAPVMAWIFRAYAREHRVWVFSRKDVLEQGTTTRDMARDLAEAMERLGIPEARVMGVSQGGMISQWLAIDAPERVGSLAIAVSLATQNESVRSVVGHWIRLAEEDRFGDLAVDTMLRTYTERGLRRWRPFMGLVRLTGRPQSKERFLVQARSCLTHDALSELGRIRCPVLVIGGAQDQIVGGRDTQEAMAAAIPASTLHVYPDLGHAAYEEAKDFNDIVLRFFRGQAQAQKGGRRAKERRPTA